jgi:hypothetical protein
MAEIHHEIKLHATEDRIRQALTSVADLKAWHGGRVTAAGDAVRFEFADAAPTFRWAIMKSGKGVVWRCLEGPGDSVGTEASFSILAGDKGRSLIEFAHRGWPHTDGNFRKCNTQWAILLHHLRQYLESGKEDPALRAPA